MKFLSTIFYAILLISVGLSCTANNRSQSELKLEKQWMLVEFQDFSKQEFIKNNAQMSGQKANSGYKYSANIGCGDIEFNIKFKDASRLAISKITKVSNTCERNNVLENAFIKSLPTMTQYTVEGHFLTLKNSKGEKMKFVAADWD